MKKGKKSTKTKAQKISSGIATVDGLTEGGYEKQSINLLVGSSGSGKSIYAMQFIMEGLKHGERGLYVSFEEKKSDFYNNMLRLGWDLELYEKKDLFTFLEYNPEKVEMMLEEGGGAIENTIVKKKVERIVIDSITSFTLLFNSDLKKREATLRLFRMIRQWQCTSLLTYEADPLAKEELEDHAIEFETDSVILLYLILNKSKRERYLEVLKMRGSHHSNKIYPAEIASKGFVVSKKPFKGTLQ